MKTNPTKQKSLESVLLDFHIDSGEAPQPAILESYCKSYPQFARELTDYALTWLVDNALATSEPVFEAAANESSPLVSRAISRLYDRIRQREAGKEAVARAQDSPAGNPFQALPVRRKRALCAQLGIDMTLFAKLQNRLIDPDTMPRRFLGRLSDALEATIEDLLSHLRLPGMANAAADFKAEAKPSAAPRKESFEAAVRASSVDEKQKETLLQD
jgi:hypothetical protein